MLKMNIFRMNVWILQVKYFQFSTEVYDFIYFWHLVYMYLYEMLHIKITTYVYEHTYSVLLI